MKGSDKGIVLGVIMAVVIAAFYFMALSPKREKASSLGSDLTKLQAQIDQEKQTAQFGEAARQDFPAYYGRLVVLGKAVPSQADTSSLMVQLNAIARRTDVTFAGIALAASGATASGSTSTPSPPSGSSTSGSTSSTSTTPSSGSSSSSSGSSASAS